MRRTKGFSLLLLLLLAERLEIAGAQNAAPTTAANAVQSAVGNQSSPATYDGIARSFSLCPASGCVVQIDPAHPLSAEPGARPTGIHQRAVDQRGGADLQTANDAGNIVFGRTCLSHFDTIGDCVNITHLVTSPGINNGTSDVLTEGQALWTVSHGILMVENCQNQGICGGIDMFLNHQGLGDTHNYRYVTTWGGQRDGSGEATQGDASTVAEASTYYTGKVVKASGFFVQTAPISGPGATGDLNDLGVGQRLVETTPASLLATGYVLSSSTLADANGKPHNVLEISGAGVTPSKWWGTLDADLANVPTIPSTGNNTVGTLRSFSVATLGGSAVPAVGDFVNLAGQYAECVQLTSVKAGVAAHYTLQAYVRRNHNKGSLLMDTPWGRGGFEFTANTIHGLRYDLDALGATDRTHLVVVKYFGSSVSSFGFGNVHLEQFFFADASLTASKGVITIPFYPENVAQQPMLQRYPLITISGATNAAFNGPCLNLHQISAGYPSKAQCTKANVPDGVSGQSGYVTFGDTGYGNSRFNLYPLAELLDIQTYGAGAMPKVRGDLRLEPNAMPLPVGGTVALDHDPAMSITGRHLGMSFSNPYCASCATDDVSVSGFDGTHFGGIRFGTPATKFAGLGGEMSPPHGPAWVRGVGGTNGVAVAADLGGMDSAPWPSGAALFSTQCPPGPLGCANPFYFYDQLNAKGLAANGKDDRYNAAHYWPATSTLVWDYLHIQVPNVPAGKGPMTYACFDADHQLVSSPTPCIP